MAYRIRYQLNVDWIGAGSGPMGNTVGLAAGVVGPMAGAQGGSGLAQTLEVANSVNAPYPAIIAGSGTGGIIQAADITALMTSMSADLTAQLNLAANLARLQGFASGGG
jgi:hypothetical protein